jgi:triphosphoribosyl-dephospho-CoA synthetase
LRFDDCLKQEGINPGTSADLSAASVLLCLLASPAEPDS